MTNRVAQHVPDNEKDPGEMPEVRVVVSSATNSSKTEKVDDFAKDAAELKSLSGTNAVFKRRVTNEIKKYQRGVGGAETKQVVDKEFFSGYDAFDVIEPPYNLDYLARLYDISPVHRAAVDAKVANIVGLGYRFTENNLTKRNLERMAGNKSKTEKTRRELNIHRDELNDMFDNLNEEASFGEVLSRAWLDYETMGNGYIEVGRKRDGTIGYIGHVPAQTLRIRRKRDGFVQISGFETQFFANFGHSTDANPLGGGRPNEIIHLVKSSPSNTYYGVPDIISAAQAVAGNEFAQKFNLDYFENKAIPRHVIIIKGATLGSAAEQALFSFFETGLKGQHHRTLLVPLPSGTKEEPVEFNIEAVEAGVQDASFANYRRANVSDILMAHRVPVTKISVSENASLSVAKDADKTFKEQVCAPQQRMLEKKLAKVVKELTDAFDLKLNEMSLTDENTQSQIDERRRKTGTETANEQRIKRGEPAIEGGDELFDMNGKAKQAEAAGTVNRERDSARSANRTDSAGEARNAKGEGRTTS